MTACNRSYWRLLSTSCKCNCIFQSTAPAPSWSGWCYNPCQAGHPERQLPSISKSNCQLHLIASQSSLVGLLSSAGDCTGYQDQGSLRTPERCCIYGYRRHIIGKDLRAWASVGPCLVQRRPINLVVGLVLTNEIGICHQASDGDSELSDNGQMFSYRQGKIVSVLGLIPLKFANRYTSIKLMGQVPFNYCQQIYR